MLRDHIQPIQHHCSGIPIEIRKQLNVLALAKTIKMDEGVRIKLLDQALELYEKLLDQCEKYEKIGDARCPVEKEEHAAEILAHQIIDLAYIHNAICSSGYQLGDFPYNDLVDKIFGAKPDANNS